MVATVFIYLYYRIGETYVSGASAHRASAGRERDDDETRSMGAVGGVRRADRSRSTDPGRATGRADDPGCGDGGDERRREGGHRAGAPSARGEPLHAHGERPDDPHRPAARLDLGVLHRARL